MGTSLLEYPLSLPTLAHGIAAGCGKTCCLGAQICAGFDQASDLLQVGMGSVAPPSHLTAGHRPGFDNGHLRGTYHVQTQAQNKHHAAAPARKVVSHS